MMELLTLIGSAGSGKIFGLLSDWQRANEEAKERAFEQDLATRNQLHGYIEAIHKGDASEKPSLMSRTLCLIYIMFAATACVACLYCFFLGFGEVTIKDPDASSGGIGIGPFKWSFAPKAVTDLSPLGVGYLILHPILFVLSMVSTGTKATRGQR